MLVEVNSNGSRVTRFHQRHCVKTGALQNVVPMGLVDDQPTVELVGMTGRA
ncbi:MAG: hypothetical protein C0P74_009430 [Gammaproteobacteria bacterium]